jgi:hypothetical protein
VEFHVLARESARNLHALVAAAPARERLRRDPRALAGLERTARAAGAPPAVRRAAAQVLVACGAAWERERVLWAGVRPAPPCPEAGRARRRRGRG